MMEIENLTAFMLTALVFIMAPGMDTAFVLNKSIGQGKKSGLYATLGVNAGVLTHTMFAAVGLSVLLSKSALALSLIKYVGAAYLIYLGFSKLWDNKNSYPANIGNQGVKNFRNDFWSGFITNTLNPKVALFFLAIFPQFINPEKIENPVPFIFLGIIYALIGMLWYTILTLFASIFGEKLKQNPKAGLCMSKISGFVFLLMGIKIALSRS